MIAKYTEKRRYPRVQKNLPLKIIDPSHHIITETKNISGSGAYCSIDSYIPPLTKLALTLLVPSVLKNQEQPHKIMCEGVVVRSEPSSNDRAEHYNIAIFFNHIKKQDTETIAKYVEWHLKGKKN